MRAGSVPPPPSSSSYQHVSTSARHHRLPIAHGKGKRRVLGGGMDTVSFRWLSLLISCLLAFVSLGGLVAITLYPHPHKGDIVVDAVPGVATSRKSLGDGGGEGELELYGHLQALVDVDGRRLSLSDVQDKVLVIVNVASQCGYTASNYAAFQELLKRYYESGLRIIAVPTDQFGNQEFKEDADIRTFVRETYDLPRTPITLVRKMTDDINQSNELFSWLRGHAMDQGGITWNFNKFLVDRTGRVRYRYDSADHLEDLERDIAGLL